MQNNLWLVNWKNRLAGTRRKEILVLVIAFIVIVLIWILLSARHRANEENSRYEIVTVKRGSIEETVTAQGKLEPKRYVDVGTQVSGQLKKIYFKIGESVKAGELIAEIDPKVYQTRVQADKARLLSLRAQLAEQKAQLLMVSQHYQRNLRLVKSNAISKEAVEDSLAAYQAAVAKLESLKAQIEEAQSTLKGSETNLNYTKIYAPIDGTVVSQNAREGQTLNANQSAPIIMQLANLDIMTVRAQVSEADVMRLKPNMEVYFNTLGNFEKKWKSKIAEILPAPDIVNDVVLYSVLIDVDNSHRQLMTGMSTQVFFIIGASDDTLIIPVSALGKRVPEQDSQGHQAYHVKVKSHWGVKDKIILIGFMNRTMAQLISGLSANDEILVPAKTPEPNRHNGGGFYRGPRL